MRRPYGDLRISNAWPFLRSLLWRSNRGKKDVALRDRATEKDSGIPRGKAESGLGAAQSNITVNNKKRLLSLTGEL